MGNGRQSHTKTSAAEQRIPTYWRQHSNKTKLTVTKCWAYLLYWKT